MKKDQKKVYLLTLDQLNFIYSGLELLEKEMVSPKMKALAGAVADSLCEQEDGQSEYEEIVGKKHTVWIWEE